MKNKHFDAIDVKSNRYPCCLVWTPLPLITAILPFIGHTGICTSSGIIHDFSGSYTVTSDSMAFGDPTKYIQLQIDSKSDWDRSIHQGDQKYQRCTHNIILNNCHSHCAYVLNQANYQGGGWTMFSIAWLFFTQSNFTSVSGFIKTYFGFFLFCLAVLYFYFNI